MPKITPATIPAALALALLQYCTAEQVYTNIQNDHVRQCRLLPVWQQEHCLSLNATSWEDYVRERQSAANQIDVIEVD